MLARGRRRGAEGGRRRAGEAELDAVQARAVVEVRGAPHPRGAPPVAHTPRVVALADAVERQLLAVDADAPADAARDLVAGRDPVRVRLAERLPHEVELDVAAGEAHREAL